ncbi:MAG: TIGR04255 family protein [Burkholderiales bacterium]|nr:TIGR04255 family protein [Burkholderiales bacterium]
MSDNRQVYPNPPAAEAIIGLQTRFRQSPSADQLTDFCQRHRESYPESAILQQLQFGFTTTVEGAELSAEQAVQRPGGLRLSTRDTKRVLQIGPDSFNYSCLKPYCGWDAFRDGAQRLWEDAATHFQFESVTRIGLRFVNQINIPGDSFDFKDYFTLYPYVPQHMQQTVNGAFMQLRFPQEDLAKNAVTIINQGLVPSTAENCITVLFDIDINTPIELDFNSEEIWDVLEKFRNRKNEFFENGICDNTRRLFQ